GRATARLGSPSRPCVYSRERRGRAMPDRSNKAMLFLARVAWEAIRFTVRGKTWLTTVVKWLLVAATLIAPVGVTTPVDIVVNPVAGNPLTFHFQMGWIISILVMAVVI